MWKELTDADHRINVTWCNCGFPHFGEKLEKDPVGSENHLKLYKTIPLNISKLQLNPFQLYGY